jgi:hypothetical protein
MCVHPTKSLNDVIDVVDNSLDDDRSLLVLDRLEQLGQRRLPATNLFFRNDLALSLYNIAGRLPGRSLGLVPVDSLARV